MMFPPSTLSPAGSTPAFEPNARRLEVELVALRYEEAACDAELIRASAATKADPANEAAARHHLDCADRLATAARDRERAEEAVLACRRTTLPGLVNGSGG